METSTINRTPTKDYIELRKKVEADHARMEKMVTVFLRVSTKGADESLNDLLNNAQDAFSNLIIHVGKFKELTAYPDMTTDGASFSDEVTQKIDAEYEKIHELSEEMVKYYKTLLQSKPELRDVLHEVAVEQGDLSANVQEGDQDAGFEVFEDRPDAQAISARSALDAHINGDIEVASGTETTTGAPGSVLEQAADEESKAQERYSDELDKTLKEAEHTYTRVVPKLAVVTEDSSNTEMKYKISFGSVILHYENVSLNDMPAEEVEADVYKVLTDLSQDKEFGLLNRDENEIAAIVQLRLEDVFNSKSSEPVHLTQIEFEDFDRQLIQNEEVAEEEDKISINPDQITVSDTMVSKAVVPPRPA